MKHVLLSLFLIFFVVIANGCTQKDDDKMELLFFSSELSSTLEDDIKSIVADGLKDSEKIKKQVEFYPVNIDKISIELVGRNGDIYFIEEETAINMIDGVSFYPLDKVAENSELSVLDDYKAVNSDTGETHVYAIPIGNNSLLINKLGIKLKSPLVALIPQYSENKEESIELLKYFSRSDY